MNSIDAGTALFEIGIAGAVWLDVRALKQHRDVRGVNFAAVVFRTIANFWFCLLYWNWQYPLSFAAASVCLMGQLTWVTLAYRAAHRKPGRLVTIRFCACTRPAEKILDGYYCLTCEREV